MLPIDVVASGEIVPSDWNSCRFSVGPMPPSAFVRLHPLDSPIHLEENPA